MTVRDGSRDFDFLFGAWQVRNRLGNMDEFTLEPPSGRVLAVTGRLYDAASGEWSIYWAASTGRGRFDRPMVGRFEGAMGEFHAQEVFEGRHILCRFIWTVQEPAACRWEQAYSPDGGRSWETNWTMEFLKAP